MSNGSLDFVPPLLSLVQHFSAPHIQTDWRRDTHIPPCAFLCTHIHSRFNFTEIMTTGNYNGLQDNRCVIKSPMCCRFIRQRNLYENLIRGMKFTICQKWVQKLKNWINFTSCCLKQNDFKNCLYYCSRCLAFFCDMCHWRLIQNLQEARIAAEQFSSGHKEDEIKTASPEIASERGLSEENSGRKKRHPLWPAIQPPLSSLCLSHHAQLIAEIHSTVCLQHQNHNHCSQEETFPANFSTFVHTKPNFPVCFLVTLWHCNFPFLLTKKTPSKRTECELLYKCWIRESFAMTCIFSYDSSSFTGAIIDVLYSLWGSGAKGVKCSELWSRLWVICSHWLAALLWRGTR